MSRIGKNPTVTTASVISTVTPAGIAIGFLPILDILYSL